MIDFGFNPADIKRGGVHVTNLEIIMKVLELASEKKSLNKNLILKGDDSFIKSCVHAADRRFDNGWSGLFDGKNFRTAGEDFDMWIKLNKIGKISYPNCRVLP